MLICGECTFLKEAQEGLGGLCAHPEKEPAPIEVKVSSTTKETYDLQIGTYKFRSYESPCRHGFCDIWAARGSARLIWNSGRVEQLDWKNPSDIVKLLTSVKQTMDPTPPVLSYRPQMALPQGGGGV